MTASGGRVYLDYNASAPLLPEARAALVASFDLIGNPSSVHAEGRAAKAALARAREQVAALVGATPDRVVFTSGATEAASTCLTPNWRRNGEPAPFDRLAVLDTDHPCIREGGRFDHAALSRLPVDAGGRMDLDALEGWCRGGPGMLALSVANSETGTVQAVDTIGEVCRRYGVVMVLDVVQLAGRAPIPFDAWAASALVLSGHKIGAPKGVGAIVLGSADMRPEPLLTGGAQETRQRAGTEALPAIVAFGAAAEVVLARRSRVGELRAMKSRLVQGLKRFDDALVLTDRADDLPQTVALHHSALRAETVQIGLDLHGIAVSAGSACSSGKIGPGHVLTALRAAGSPVDPDAGMIRVSFGFETTDAEIDRFLSAFGDIWSRSALRQGSKAA